MALRFRYSWRRFGVALLLGLGYLGWQVRPFNPSREFGLKTPAVPRPNAHDVYLAAAAQIRRETVNAQTDPDATSGVVKTYSLAAKTAWLKQNKAGFDLFKQAQKLPYYLPPSREELPGGELPYPVKLRWLARALTVPVEVAAAQHRPAEAAEWALDAWKLGLDMERGAHLTAALNAFGCEAIARNALDPQIANLSGPEAAQIARRLEILLATRLPLAAIWAEERAAFLWQFKPKAEQGFWEEEQDEINRDRAKRGEPALPYATGAPKISGPLINYGIRVQAEQYVSGMDWLIASASANWPQRPLTFPEFPGPNDEIPAMLRATSKVRFYHARTETQGHIFLTRLALHAYRSDRGAYPPQLAGLVPGYLREIPLDAFSNAQPLRYRREGSRYKLWSIGPDARDDGARPLQNPDAKTAAARYLITETASGDIVANINK